MLRQPNWLDIDEELYPETAMTKVFSLQDQLAGVPIHIPVYLAYDSCHREINITESIADIIAEFYSPSGDFYVRIFNPETDSYQVLGMFPFKEPLILKGCYLECPQLVFQIEELGDSQQQKIEKKEKTVRQILSKVSQWRKIYMQKDPKVNLEQAAATTGIPRNTLDDYYWHLKTAQKYGFDFKKNIDCPLKVLRKFVKENHQKKEKKKNPIHQLLQKYHQK